MLNSSSLVLDLAEIFHKHPLLTSAGNRGHTGDIRVLQSIQTSPFRGCLWLFLKDVGWVGVAQDSFHTAERRIRPHVPHTTSWCGPSNRISEALLPLLTPIKGVELQKEKL